MNNEDKEVKENNLKSIVKKFKYCCNGKYLNRVYKSASENPIVRNGDVESTTKELGRANQLE